MGLNDFDFDFDLDLSCAATVPSTLYRDAQLAALEPDRIFARTWQLARTTGGATPSCARTDCTTSTRS
jgi:hypothetical protein